jgi:hypothetical protein
VRSEPSFEERSRYEEQKRRDADRAWREKGPMPPPEMPPTPPTPGSVRDDFQKRLAGEWESLARRERALRGAIGGSLADRRERDKDHTKVVKEMNELRDLAEFHARNARGEIPDDINAPRRRAVLAEVGFQGDPRGAMGRLLAEMDKLVSGKEAVRFADPGEEPAWMVMAGLGGGPAKKRNLWDLINTKQPNGRFLFGKKSFADAVKDRLKEPKGSLREIIDVWDSYEAEHPGSVDFRVKRLSRGLQDALQHFPAAQRINVLRAVLGMVEWDPEWKAAEAPLPAFKSKWKSSGGGGGGGGGPG